MKYIELFTLFFLFVFTEMACSNSQNKKTTIHFTRYDTINFFSESFVENQYNLFPLLSFEYARSLHQYTIKHIGIDSINFDDSTEVDTIYIVSGNEDTLLYAKANSGIFLWKMVLNSVKDTLDTGIAIGCSADVLSKKFKINTLPDSCIFCMSGPSENYYFVIKNKTVKKIYYDIDFEGNN